MASEAEAAELNLLVLGNPEVARELARAARRERSLEVASRMAEDGFRAPPPHAAPVATAPQRRTTLAIGAGVAVLVAGLVFGWFFRPSLRSAHMANSANSASSAHSATAGAIVKAAPAASASSSGLAGQTPRPGYDPARRLLFADGSFADLRDEGSQLETRVSSKTAIDVVLAQGAARFQVVPLPGRRFRVWVGGSTYVEVIGTIFTVERLATGVRVSVERGTVKVVSPRNETRISAGLAEMIAFESPRAHEAPADRARDRVRPHVGESEATVMANHEAGLLLTASADARRAHRPEEAAALLQRFLDRHAHDPRAGYAAFILGRVLLEELARPAEAAAAFARVETLDPRTPLVEDALAREVESRARAGDKGRAQQRARAYLDRYPNGARAEEVRRYSRVTVDPVDPVK